MVKRGREGDGAGLGAATATTDDRVRLMAAHRRHLNESFLAELTRKIRANPAGVYEREAADYAKFSKHIRDNFKDVAAASESASALVATRAGAVEKQGECFVWGTGDAGQLGLGDDIFELTRPKLLSTLPSATPVLKVVCGGMHTLAIIQGGLVYSWGVNDEGALAGRGNLSL